MKHKRAISVFSLVVLVCLLLGAPSLIAAREKDQLQFEPANSWLPRNSIAGTWIASLPEPSLEESLIWTVTLTPTNLAGTRLAYTGYGPNPFLNFLPALPTSGVAGLAIGEFVRTGKDTYEFTIISHAAEAPPEEPFRGLITWFWVWTGTARLIDENNFVKEDTVFSIYSAQDVYDPDTGELMIPNQDADHDGLPDEGAVPIASMPWDEEFTRVRVGYPE